MQSPIMRSHINQPGQECWAFSESIWWCEESSSQPTGQIRSRWSNSRGIGKYLECIAWCCTSWKTNRLPPYLPPRKYQTPKDTRKMSLQDQCSLYPSAWHLCHLSDSEMCFKVTRGRVRSRSGRVIRRRSQSIRRRLEKGRRGRFLSFTEIPLYTKMDLYVKS